MIDIWNSLNIQALTGKTIFSIISKLKMYTDFVWYDMTWYIFIYWNRETIFSVSIYMLRNKKIYAFWNRVRDEHKPLLFPFLYQGMVIDWGLQINSNRMKL